MQHYAAFHLGLHCLPKHPFRGFQYTKAKNVRALFSLKLAVKFMFYKIYVDQFMRFLDTFRTNADTKEPLLLAYTKYGM